MLRAKQGRSAAPHRGHPRSYATPVGGFTAAPVLRKERPALPRCQDRSPVGAGVGTQGGRAARGQAGGVGPLRRWEPQPGLQPGGRRRA